MKKTTVAKPENKKNPHRGSSFDDFLREEGMYEEVHGAATKSVLAWQIKQALEEQKITKAQLAERMKTSRAVVNRMLNPDNSSISLQTMLRAANALGKRLSIQFVEE